MSSFPASITSNPAPSSPSSLPEDAGSFMEDQDEDHDATDLQNRIEQRSRQIIFGKVTPEYWNLQQQVKLRAVAAERPMTPQLGLEHSNSLFSSQTKDWRKKLHKWNPSDLTTNRSYSKENWISPALQYAFDLLKHKYPAAKTPLELIEGTTKAPSHVVLKLINEFFNFYFDFIFLSFDPTRCLQEEVCIPKRTAAKESPFWETTYT